MGEGEKRYYGTWTALQARIRAHLGLHEEREIEDGLDVDVSDEADDRPEKTRMGILGEIGNVLFKGVIKILNL